MSLHGFMVAGTHSGVGKTSVTLGLARALRQQGRKVSAYKTGPDFLDALWLAAATGSAPRNLDAWMAGPSLRNLFAQSARKADLIMVEGMMGLFDGVSPSHEEGSSAELAKILGLPVILVVDASAMARSVAALVKGFQTFDPDLHLAGVIANRVGGPGHAQMLAEALAPLGVPLLGALPRMETSMPERHLGLKTPESGESTSLLDSLASMMAQHADLTRIGQLLLTKPLSLEETSKEEPSFRRGTTHRVAIARDEAFHFYYEDNLDLLRSLGVELQPFSPLRDASIPTDCNLLLLGGGYPEEHARDLSRNTSMLGSLRAFAAKGRIYAECGGLMYLSQRLASLEGDSIPMAGLIPGTCVMGSQAAQIGHRMISTQGPWLGGLELRGHEFHYSHLEPDTTRPAARLRHPRRGEWRADGFASPALFATYAHLYWPSEPSIVSRLLP
ncbi:MAG: cobyrinate a,c-diamide synthase [Planctomycetota bacterium]